MRIHMEYVRITISQVTDSCSFATADLMRGSCNECQSRRCLGCVDSDLRDRHLRFLGARRRAKTDAPCEGDRQGSKEVDRCEERIRPERAWTCSVEDWVPCAERADPDQSRLPSRPHGKRAGRPRMRREISS